MATRKVAVTLDEDQRARIRRLVSAGHATTVSGFVEHALGVALDWARRGRRCATSEPDDLRRLDCDLPVVTI